MDTLRPNRKPKTHIFKEALNNLNKIGIGPILAMTRWADPPPPPDWREPLGLSPEIKDHPAITKYKSADEALKGLVEAQKFIGMDKIPVPPAGAKEDVWSQVWKTLGRPEKPDDYKLPQDIKLPEKFPALSDEMAKAYREQSHKLGLLPAQVEGLYRWFMGANIDQFNTLMKAGDDATKDAETAMRSEWGAGYSEKIALAQKVYRSFADEEAGRAFDAGLGNNPHILRVFAKIGEVLSDDQLTGKAPQLTLTPQEAQGELDKLNVDIKGPLYDAAHPEHAAAVERRRQLYELANPNK